MGAVFWLSQSSLLAVENIEVEGNHAVPLEQVLETATPLLMGESLIRLSYDEVERGLTAMPFVESVEIERDFPHTLRIRLRERQVATTLISGDGRLLLVATDGLVLAQVDAPALGYPVLAASGPCDAQVGEVPDCQDIKVGIRFVSDIPTNFNREFSDVAVEEGYIRALTRSGVLVIFGTLDDYGLKFEVLRQLLARAGVEGQPVTIDVSVPERPVTREGLEESAAPVGDTQAPGEDAADTVDGTAAGAEATSPGTITREAVNG